MASPATVVFWALLLAAAATSVSFTVAVSSKLAALMVEFLR